MQKKILAVAVAGALAAPAVAFAQSSVTIYGAFDVSVNNYRVSRGTGAASISKMEIYNQSSRIGFRGEENLGGGLRAWFQAENNIEADLNRANNNTSNFGSRNTGIGLTGGWGTVMLGGWDSPYKVSIGGITGMAVTGGWAGHNGPAIGNGDTTGANPNANCDNLVQAGGTVTGVGGGAGSVGVCPRGLEGGSTQFHRRISNTVQYWSPKFGGFDFRVAVTANEEKATTAAFNNNPQLWAASGTYSAGPWYATIAYEQHRGYRDTPTTTSTMNTKDKGWLIGGGYNFGAAALNIGYERLRYGNAKSGVGGTDNSFRRPSWFIGASVPLGPSGSALRAGYSKMSGLKSCGADVVCGSNTGLSVFTLGYEYAMSKRTAAYVQYGTIRNKTASAVLFNTPPLATGGGTTAIAADADPSILGVGVKHTF